jgi:hypothetical protein
MAKLINNSPKSGKMVDEFLRKYQIQARRSSKQARRIPEFKPYDFNHYAVEYQMHVETYEVFELEMAEDALLELAERDQTINEIERNWGPNAVHHYQEARQIIWYNSHDARIRSSNPGVQKAWERYQMLLKIAGG